MWVGKVQQTGASTKSFIGERENRFQVSDTQKLSHINKEVGKDFLHKFCSFRAISAPFHLLSVTLESHCFHVFRTALWLKMWSKTLPSFADGMSAGAEERRFSGYQSSAW